MEYQTYPPPPSLEPYIQCFWTLQGGAVEEQIVVPDGCMEMIFHYGDLYRQRSGSNYILQPRCFAIGQLTRPLALAPQGRTDIFAVRFKADGFLPFATIPIKAMENTAIPLEELYEQACKNFEILMLELTDTQAKIDTCITFLNDVLQKHSEKLVQATAQLIYAAKGKLPVSTLADQNAISPRTLERKFRKEIGLSPKQFSKIVRLQTALKILLSEEKTDLTALAYASDYYDQAHFIRDFKELTGLNPTAFFGPKVEMSTLFYKKT